MNDITALMATMKAAAEKATPGEWWSDVVETDGEYGDGEDRHSGYHSYAVYVGNESLLDMTNSTAACIHEEWDHDYHMAWDETAKRNAEFIAVASPDNVKALVEALEKAQSELAKANGVLDKIKSTSCHVDTSEGSFIPNSLDAWGRPVPQHLPYDFSGNPGASATQYCNGWNDAGGYWLNYVQELESRTVTVKLRDINEYLADVHDKTLALTFRRLAEGVRAGDIAAMTAAGIQVIEGEGQ